MLAEVLDQSIPPSDCWPVADAIRQQRWWLETYPSPILVQVQQVLNSLVTNLVCHLCQRVWLQRRHWCNLSWESCRGIEPWAKTTVKRKKI